MNILGSEANLAETLPTAVNSFNLVLLITQRFVFNVLFVVVELVVIHQAIRVCVALCLKLQCVITVILFVLE